VAALTTQSTNSMGHLKVDRPVALMIATALGAALVGATLLGPATTNLARAQTEPPTAANGVLLPPLDYDPVAARNGDVVESASAPGTPTPAGSLAESSDVVDAPENGNSMTTSLGGSDVMVSSVGGSNEVDRPSKRSGKK
jgi:hypothetical protein